MKQTVFDLSPPIDETYENRGDSRILVQRFQVPTSSAYAAEFLSVQANGRVLSLARECLSNDVLTIFSTVRLITNQDQARLVLHHLGIQDYSMLFRQVEPPALRTRLGEFYEEAEKAFENSAWLSFSLACGAVVEGLLFARASKKDGRFQQLIDDAPVDVLSQADKDLAHRLRNHRNLVHANRFIEPFVTRAEVMQAYVLMTTLVKRAPEVTTLP